MKKLVKVLVLLIIMGCFVGTNIEASEKGKTKPEEIKLQIKRLKSDDSNERMDAVLILGEIGNKTAVPVLIEALKDKNKSVRHIAAQSLSKIGKPAVRSLLKALKKEQLAAEKTGDDSRMYAMHGITYALGQIGDKSAITPLFELVKNDKDPNVKMHAAEALCMMRDESIIYDLMKLKMEEFIRIEATYGDPKGDGPQDLTTLMSIDMAVFNMRKLIYPTLVKGLNHEDWMVRCYAVTVLYQVDFGCVYDKPTINLITDRVEDENEYVRLAALGLLKAIAHKDVGENRESWQKWFENVVVEKGTVEFSNLEGGFYDIAADDGKRYSPIELSQKFQVDGMRVRFFAEITKGAISIPRRGKLIKILKIEKLK